MSRFPIVVAVLLLAACVSEQELAAEDAARCRSFGLQPETEAYSNCLMQLYIARTRRPVFIEQPPAFPPPPRVIVVPEKK